MPNFTIGFRAMGSAINVWLNVPDIAEAGILQKIPDLFEAWEARFSRFRPNSELSQLNAGAGKWQLVSGQMAEVLSLALAASVKTDGVFNPLILAALESAGYDHSFDDPASFVPAPLGEAETVPDFRQIEYEDATSTLRIPAGARLDLGGIVKGWAAQKAAEYLYQYGACMVDAGGDIVARGAPDDSGGWLVTIAHPQTEQPLCTVLLKDAAIATSGIDYRHWKRDGQTLHHLIDPRTGLPAQTNILSATVVAESAAQAEVWAKVSLIRGIPPELPAALIDQDGSANFTPQFERLIVEEQR